MKPHLTPVQQEFADGKLLLFDKPAKWTSFDVVNYVRKVISPPRKKTKTGHAGTLDPLATGLLIICTGTFTKKLEELTGQEKEYTGIITLGKTTPSFDLETEINEEFPINHIEDKSIHEAAKLFLGKTMQQPPLYSAKKIDGERAYYKARRGEETETKQVEVEVSEFEINKIERKEASIEVYFTIVCSKGTYIRSIANDFGRKLNSGSHLSLLRRTRIGKYKVEDAFTLESFKNKYSRLALNHSESAT